MKLKVISLFIFIFFTSAFSSGEAKTYTSSGQKFNVEKIFEGDDVIWGFDFLKDGSQILFSERNGKLKLVDIKSKKVTEILGVPKVFTDSQGGLLDVYLDSKTQFVYLTYSEPTPKGATTSLFRGKLSTDNKKIIGERFFQAQAFANGGIHYGSRVVIDQNGFIFLSVGERNVRDRAQDLNTHQGKILRLNSDGTIPKDNPFVANKVALGEIWSLGHRNPQGLIIDSKGQLLNAEFGPRGGDEVNLVIKGANYGWPVVTYGSEYYGPSIGTKSKEGMIQPLYYWVPSISPSGLMEYTANVFPNFKGNLFLATLSGMHLHRIVTGSERQILQEEKLLLDLEERFRQVKLGPEGFIYLSTDSGKLLRLVPAP
ncbi:MAG: PQQ-dependent sugar dehydrogenase [Bacteriovoracaceae bacterium]|nr:PQQ-dependent sugar dehydrogenase [Bacteriovoracaceae bacterium]